MTLDQTIQTYLSAFHRFTPKTRILRIDGKQVNRGDGQNRNNWPNCAWVTERELAARLRRLIEKKIQRELKRLARNRQQTEAYVLDLQVQRVNKSETNKALQGPK